MSDISLIERSSEDVKSISHFVKQRGVLKGKLTRFKKTDSIYKDFEKYERVQDELDLLCRENELDGQITERTIFSDAFYEYTSKAETFLNNHKPDSTNTISIPFGVEDENLTPPLISNTVDPTSSSNIHSSNELSISHVKMPTMQLPKFNNTCENWPSFADSFKASIHNNSRLRDSEKLMYLKSCLTGKALFKIESIEQTDRHYNLAWSILEKSFDNPVAAANKRIKAIFEIPHCTKATEKSIGEIIDVATKHYCALEALNKPFLEAFPVYAITSKLDEETRRKWKELNQKIEFPSMHELLQFLHERQRVLEEDSEKKPNHAGPSLAKSKIPNFKNSQTTLTSTENSTKLPIACNLCKGPHYTSACDTFENKTSSERFDLIKNARLCINCFRSNHTVSTCQSLSRCKTCHKRHHTLLHHELENTVVSNFAKLYANVPSQVLLSTAIINILDKDNNSHECRILLDSGSQSNFITERFASILKLPQTQINVPVIGIHQIQTNISKSIVAKIISRSTRYTKELNFLIIPKITGRLPSIQLCKNQLTIPTNITLADPEFDKPRDIDALLGAEIFYNLLSIGQIAIAKPSAVLQKTQLGWIISGRILNEDPQEPAMCNISLDILNTNITRFWEIEEGPNKKLLSVEDQECESHFAQHTKRDEITGKFIVKLPFSTNKPNLGNSYNSALRRFLSLERSFVDKPKQWKQYVDFMREYEKLNHMSLCENHNTNEGYYLPHHAVFKASSLTTKIRVVFDASAKTTTGISLNDVLLVGPKVQDDLFFLTLRFRVHVYVLTADAEKMYRQIIVHPEHRIYQKILWRHSSETPVQVFQLNTVTYGQAPSSYLSAKILHKLADDERVNYPVAARILYEDFYVDDLLTGAETFDEALLIRNELIAVTKTAGINLRQWSSNEPKLTNDLVDKSDDKYIKLDLDENIKTLGIQWNPKKDLICYTVNLDCNTTKITKRIILSEIACLFDPLGLVGPTIVKAKILMQTLWQLKLEWDESIPADLYTFWMQYRSELPLLEKMSIPRRTILSERTTLQLHGFSDASERAYGACLYIRSEDNYGHCTSVILNSKSRVAPLKYRSIPRLELCAAHLLSNLVEVTLQALKNIKFDDIYLWSDSTIVLHWIKTLSNSLKTFVRNRISEIQNVKYNATWGHVSTKHNPADMISRGLLPSELYLNQFWINGPNWLIERQTQWPKCDMTPIDLPELRETFVLSCIPKPDLPIDFKRYSSFKTLKRIIAYVIRFINIKCRKQKLIGPLCVNELQASSTTIMKIIQYDEFQREIHLLKSNKCYTGKLTPLSPFIDTDGVLRVGGRLRLSELTYNQKHPILLPSNHYVTNLIIRETHIKNKHSGAQATLCAIRSSFWIINGRNAVKSIIHKCILCFRAKPPITQYKMGNLPKNRLVFKRPFLQTGIDFCGPFYIKEKRFRNRNKVKINAAIFVCFATKAIHIELVQDLTAEAFLAALRRFFARRGKSSDLYSDNATNFVGAKRELDEISKFLKTNDQTSTISNMLANENITWHFIPPRSPNFGGLWEAAVKSFKHHVTRVIGDTLLTFETLMTYVNEIEAILNPRPLTPMSSDPNDLSVLTPGHFLIGDWLTNLPESNFSDVPSPRLSSWQHVQQLKQHFWSRWSKEYLHELTVRKKWHTGATDNIKTEAIVLLKEDNLPPMRWKLGKIIEIHPGNDGIVRVVTVKTPNGQYKRSIKQLAPLPIET